MSWLAFMHGSDVVGFVSALVTVIGGIGGLVVAGQQINKRNFEKKFGSIHSEEDWMGYFAMKIPFYWFQAPCQLVPPTPDLFTVSGLIKAGDDGIFTSSMVEWMQRDYERVSWKALYEAFLLEYVWACSKVGTKQPLREKSLLNSVNKAEHEVQKRIERAEIGKPRIYTCPLKRLLCKVWKYLLQLVTWKHLLQLATTAKGCIISILAFCCILPSERKTIPKIKTIESISPLISEIPSIDPHLLYYKWRPPSTGQGARTPKGGYDTELANGTRLSGFIGPLLVRSSKRLPKFRSSIPDDLKTITPWFKDFRKLWTYNGKPCIQTFNEELYPLALFLGMPLKCHDPFQPEGMGAFGTVLVSESDFYTRIQLVYGKLNQSDKSASGSGYSILFAKHMACGCLPFSQTVVDGERTYTLTVVVTEKTKEYIKAGMPFDNAATDHHYWHDAASLTLSKFSSSTVIDYCFPSREPDYAEECGGSLYCWDGGIKSSAGTWTEAVAGIAFGGLVPMATRPLVDAVRYTIGGSLEKEEEISAFNTLMEAICTHAKGKVPGTKSIPLFGSWYLRWVQNKRHTAISFKRYLSDRRSMADVVTILGMYTTILDYLIAATLPSADSGNVDSTASVEESQLQKVFEECAYDISNHYMLAVAVTRSDERLVLLTEAGKTEIETTLREITDKLNRDECITVRDCGRVARCIIMAWTKLVRTVSWVNRNRADQGDIELLPLKDFPYIAAWG